MASLNEIKKMPMELKSQLKICSNKSRYLGREHHVRIPTQLCR